MKLTIDYTLELPRETITRQVEVDVYGVRHYAHKTTYTYQMKDGSRHSIDVPVDPTMEVKHI